uniref:Uncharacterized protein n=1 Tax=Opuntia streptacantha TaxID=393608 RepID=A0A7C9DA55_OPUST
MFAVRSRPKRNFVAAGDRWLFSGERFETIVSNSFLCSASEAIDNGDAVGVVLRLEREIPGNRRFAWCMRQMSMISGSISFSLIADMTLWKKSELSLARSSTHGFFKLAGEAPASFTGHPKSVGS